jgi:hypothetical protein
VSGTMEPFLREPAPGHGPVKTNLVQRRERSHGKGNSRPSFEADRKIDARSKTGKAPDGNTDMHEPANESLLTDVSGFAPTVARSSHRSPLRSSWRGRAVAPSGLDMGHKRMDRPELRQCSGRRPSRLGRIAAKCTQAAPAMATSHLRVTVASEPYLAADQTPPRRRPRHPSCRGSRPWNIRWRAARRNWRARRR